MAKRAGVRVDEFGFGFPPRIFGIKKGETIYSLNLFPIGGFVKIYGEEGQGKNDPRSFASKSISRRSKILVAGVAMNFFLAALLLSIGYNIGLPAVIEDETKDSLINTKIQVAQVAPDSPAAQAGIMMGDTIASLKTQNLKLENIESVKQIQEFIDTHKGEEIILTIQRGDEVLEKTLVPRQNPPADQGPMGVALVKTAIVSYPWYRALIMGLTSTVNLTLVIIVAVAGLLWQLITTGQLMAEISGPVGIFMLTGQAAKLGFIYLLQFTALLSINLAIINALPFPALDGGRLLFLGIEKIKGSPVSQPVEKFVHTAGFVLLILLMIAVTWRDVVKLF